MLLKLLKFIKISTWSSTKRRLQESKTTTNQVEKIMSNIPKINVRNSVSECALSLRKENQGKYRNYGIKDCIASIAATKVK